MDGEIAFHTTYIVSTGAQVVVGFTSRIAIQLLKNGKLVLMVFDY